MEANYRGRGKGRYYKGKIARERANGTFDINYDDGERELGVDRDLDIRSLKDDGGIAQSPEAVAADWRRAPRSRATTVAVAASGTRQDRTESANGTFDIDYDDGEREMGVDRDYGRALKDGRPAWPSPLRRWQADWRRAPRWRATTAAAASGTPAKIARERANGTFDINYDDGERELDVDVMTARRSRWR